jgi:hypothetical protein
MSVTSSFRYHRPFPYCPEPFDIDGIDDSDIPQTTSYVRDLTLAEAMKIVWLLEGLRLCVKASARFDVLATATIDFDETATDELSPRARICSGPYGFGYNQEEAITIVYDEAPELLFTDAFEGVINTFGYSAVPATYLDVRRVTKQIDGLYTVWFDVEFTGRDYITFGLWGRGSGGDFPSRTNIDAIDIEVLPGRFLKIKLYVEQSTTLGLYEPGSAVVESFFGTVSFFTFD